MRNEKIAPGFSGWVPVGVVAWWLMVACRLYYATCWMLIPVHISTPAIREQKRLPFKCGGVVLEIVQDTKMFMLVGNIPN